MKNKFPWEALLVAAFLYVVFSATWYRFSHPEQTDTQLFLNIGKALTWQK